MKTLRCIDDEGLEGWIEYGALYNVDTSLPCGAVKLLADNGLVLVCARSRFR